MVRRKERNKRNGMPTVNRFNEKPRAEKRNAVGAGLHD